MNSNTNTSWVEVNLDAIRNNFRTLQEIAHPAQALAVVKSEAYGHGLEAVAMTANEEGAWGFAVVSVSEGRRLRNVGIIKPILLIAPILPSQIDSAITDNLRPVVFDYEFAKLLSDRSLEMHKVTKVHLKVDTGMGRLSVPAEATTEFAVKVSKLPGVEIEGIYSHLAAADGLDQSYTKIQYQRFVRCVRMLKDAGVTVPYRHLAASSGTLLLSKARLDICRLGIALYGQWPSREVRMLMASQDANLRELADLQVTGDPVKDAEGKALMESNLAADLLTPAMTFKTVVAQVKSVKAGACISYGCTFKCHRQTTIAVLPIGYADGYDRHLSNVGEVLIRGYRAPIVGRICMNICMVDVTDIPGVVEGDEVVLMGRQGEEYVSADELAEKIGTINYEIITRIPMHIPRIYLGKLPENFTPQQ